jgi:hypothetical protein
VPELEEEEVATGALGSFTTYTAKKQRLKSTHRTNEK